MTLDPHHNKCTKPNTMELEQEEFMEDDSSNININDLPDEVLEYIFSFVSPYKDLKECMLVCKRWHENVKSKFFTFGPLNAHFVNISKAS